MSEVIEGDHVGFVPARGSTPSTRGIISSDQYWLSSETDIRDRVEALLWSDGLTVAPATRGGNHRGAITHSTVQLVALLVYEELALDTLEPWSHTCITMH